MNDSPVIRRRHFLARALGLLAGGTWLGSEAATREAAAEIQADQQFIGEIKMFAGNFAPLGWAFCDGQLLSTQEFDQLFNLIGTTYGGDGVVSFALPDLRGRAPMHQGSAHLLGEGGGNEDVTLTLAQMPAHAHSPMGTPVAGDSNDPSGRVPARSAAGAPHYGGSVDTTLNANAVNISGGSAPHNNMMPSLGINFIIALEGVYPQPN